jgi:hypothetical protein
VKRAGPVQRDPDNAALLSEGLEYGLPNPPHGITDELDALGFVELVGGANETEVALVDQIEERDPLVLILFGDRHDKPEVRADQLVERLFLPSLDTLSSALSIRGY